VMVSGINSDLPGPILACQRRLKVDPPLFGSPK
jgi:hypothetical protein